jgi:hypothetical protein
VSFLAFFFIVVSLLSFVVAQLVLKRAMEFSAKSGLRNSRFIWLISVGVALMNISIFITPGLNKLNAITNHYPIQWFSVNIITPIAGVLFN